MKKKLILIACVAILALGAGITAVALRSNKNDDKTTAKPIANTSELNNPGSLSDPSDAVSSPPQPKEKPAEEKPAPSDDKQTKVTGKVTCLSPASQDGAQNTSCAIGLESNGKMYALHNPDPSVVGSLPTGQKVEVTGTVTQPDAQSDAPGIIGVTSVKRL
ncbi:MAG TPA: hypothetical protein VD735_06570 [Candidatus Saccharimonadales bacterium]|nr:hypothetical protein [Candidatus Saccharimonadales bacterium]